MPRFCPSSGRCMDAMKQLANANLPPLSFVIDEVLHGRNIPLSSIGNLVGQMAGAPPQADGRKRRESGRGEQRGYEDEAH